ncbi:MAG: hypothetical protein MJ252_16220 [archaeon]|nr:hypothetical protein [archaeon]
MIQLTKYSEYEQRIIEDVLEVSGISVKPTQSELNEFLRRIKTLNLNVIYDLLNEKMRSLMQINETKSLTVIYLF